MANEEMKGNVYSFIDEKPVPDPVYEYSDSLHNNIVLLITDNGRFYLQSQELGRTGERSSTRRALYQIGTYQCRAGWACNESPSLKFKNITAKQRVKKNQNEIETLIGNDITNVEIVKWILRSQFDHNIVTLFDIQEQVFDYLFSHLGITTEGSVEHPIVLTEAVCNPNYTRQSTERFTAIIYSSNKRN